MANLTIGLVGTAGRGQDGAKMNEKIYNAIVQSSLVLILKHCPRPSQSLDFPEPLLEIQLYSGGSAWADHAAIDVWKIICAMVEEKKLANHVLKPTLTLFLPCYIRSNGEQFQFIDGDLNKEGCASALNKYHAHFSKKMSRNTIKEIAEAEKLGAKLAYCKGGFKKLRNAQVAKHSRHLLIAYTWGESTTEPKDGGTMDTWAKCHAKKKIHVPLASLCNDNL